MKQIYLLLVYQLFAVSAIPLDGTADEQWSILPDGSGNMHIINKRLVELDVNVTVEPVKFDPANDTKFLLYTPENPETPQQLLLNDTQVLLSSNFNPSRPTRFSVHGWINDGESSVNNNIREGYLKAGNFNVIVVDWGAGSLSEYSIARKRVDPVGQVVANFIEFLYKVTGVDIQSIYLAGHSLGSHVAGFAGKYLTRGRIPVIFALDPALPLFSYDKPAERIADTDADYVEVIHTNAKNLGFDAQIGHADFYPNFGSQQNGCITNTCCHQRSHIYFAESLYSTTDFWAKRCNDWKEIINDKQCTENGPAAVMGGEPANVNTLGVYYLPTNKRTPFAMGEF